MPNRIPNQTLGADEVIKIVQQQIQNQQKQAQFSGFGLPIHQHNGVDMIPIFFNDIKKSTIFISDTQNQLAASSYAVSHTIFVNPSPSSNYILSSVSVVFGTAGGTSCAVQVEVATGTTSIGSGTAQLLSPIGLTGSANTPIAGSVIKVPNVITQGSRINIIFSGTVTGLAAFCISLVLTKIGK